MFFMCKNQPLDGLFAQGIAVTEVTSDVARCGHIRPNGNDENARLKR